MWDCKKSSFKYTWGRILCGVICFLGVGSTYGLDGYKLKEGVDEFYFTGDYIEVLDDELGDLTFDDVRSDKFDDRFKSREEALSTRKVPRTNKSDSYYWIRIKIDHTSTPNSVWLLEFPNQSIDKVEYFLPQSEAEYKRGVFGDHYQFAEREIEHKNFQLIIDPSLKGTKYYYFRIKCSLPMEVVVLVQSLEKFVSYSLNEYLMFGFFYGMILIVSLYNLLMFLALGEKQFLFYILYIVCFGLFFMSDNGTGFQYLWPNSPGVNDKASAFFAYLVVLFAMLFTREFLETKTQFPFVDKLIIWMIGFRTVFFLGSLIFDSLYTFKIIDVFSIGLGLYTGILGSINGFRPSRFYLLGYGFLFIGFVIKCLTQIGVLPTDLAVNFYSMNIALCFDMLFITFAFGDKISLIRQDKERAHKKVIQSLEKNQKLKDKVNRELEAQVTLRTIELDENNKLLRDANEKMKEQSEEINRMNMMLDLDNRNLKKNIKETLVARIMKPNVDFDEFRKVFPDNISCFKYLYQKKQEEGFVCSKCSNEKFSDGTKKFSRRCSKCGYNESVTANTIFHGIRFPIEKAFYIFYLTITKRDSVTIDQMSELVSLRRNTCWAFKKKVVNGLEEMKMENVKELAESWGVIFSKVKN